MAPRTARPSFDEVVLWLAASLVVEAGVIYFLNPPAERPKPNRLHEVCRL